LRKLSWEHDRHGPRQHSRIFPSSRRNGTRPERPRHWPVKLSILTQSSDRACEGPAASPTCWTGPVLVGRPGAGWSLPQLAVHTATAQAIYLTWSAPQRPGRATHGCWMPCGYARSSTYARSTAFGHALRGPYLERKGVRIDRWALAHRIGFAAFELVPLRCF